MSHDKLYIATLARHGRPSRNQGTSSSTIKRIPFARTSGFDDSIRCTSVATSLNLIIGPAAFGSRFRQNFCQTQKKKARCNDSKYSCTRTWRLALGNTLQPIFFRAVSYKSSSSVFLNHCRTLRTKQRRRPKASGFRKQCHEESTTSSHVMTPLV